MAGASPIRKVFDFIWGEGEQEGTPDEYDENVYSDYAEDYDNGEEEVENEPISLFKRKKTTQIPQTQSITMKISKPTNFDQADEIVMQLKARNAVVINLEYVSKDVARRIVDVVCGAVKALDGNMEKVSNSIFVVAPCNYDIVNEITREKIERKFSDTWIK